jgi:hypothetical protein
MSDLIERAQNRADSLKVGPDAHLFRSLAARIKELEAERDALQQRLDLEADSYAHDAIEAATIERLKNSIDVRMNDRLCEMKPNYDDSITGFNEAWDIARAVFRNAIRALAKPPPTASAQ